MSQGASLCPLLPSAAGRLLQWWGACPFTQLASLADRCPTPDCWLVSRQTLALRRHHGLCRGYSVLPGGSLSVTKQNVWVVCRTCWLMCCQYWASLPLRNVARSSSLAVPVACQYHHRPHSPIPPTWKGIDTKKEAHKQETSISHSETFAFRLLSLHIYTLQQRCALY